MLEKRADVCAVLLACILVFHVRVGGSRTPPEKLTAGCAVQGSHEQPRYKRHTNGQSSPQNRPPGEERGLEASHDDKVGRGRLTWPMLLLRTRHE